VTGDDRFHGGPQPVDVHGPADFNGKRGVIFRASTAGLQLPEPELLSRELKTFDG
jgi:hypothetical protein